MQNRLKLVDAITAVVAKHMKRLLAGDTAVQEELYAILAGGDDAEKDEAQHTQMRDADDPIKYRLGDIVAIRPHADWLGVVRGIYCTGDEIKYECSWMDNTGHRHVEFFLAEELEEAKQK